MKKTIQGLLCMLLVVLLTACSENAKLKGLLQQVPAETDMVMAGNVKNVLESMGGSVEKSQIKMPGVIMDNLSDLEINKCEEWKYKFKNSGVDMEAAVFMLDFRKDVPVVVLGIDDTDLFTKFLEDEGYREKDSENDVKFFAKQLDKDINPDYSPFSYVALNGDCAYYIHSIKYNSEVKGVSYLKRLIENAAERNMAETEYGEYLLDGNACGIAVNIPQQMKNRMREEGVPEEMLSLYNGIFCMRGNLTDKQCKVDIKLFDENGKAVTPEMFSKYIDLSSTISKEALEFLGKDEMMVYAASLKKVNWDLYNEMFASMSQYSRSERANLRVMLDYLKNIEGTVAMGMGLTNGLESVYSVQYDRENMLNQFSVTLVVETKQGKNKNLVKDMQTLAEQSGLAVKKSADGFSIATENMGMKGALHVKMQDNYLVLANHPIQKSNQNPVVKNSNMSDYLIAFGLSVDKNSKLAKDLQLDCGINMVAYNKPNSLEGTLLVEVDGEVKDGVITKLVSLFSGMSKRMEQVEKQCRERYYEQQMQRYNEEQAVIDSLAN